MGAAEEKLSEARKLLETAHWKSVGSEHDDHRLEQAYFGSLDHGFIARRKTSAPRQTYVKWNEASVINWFCGGCGNEVHVTEVIHPIHDGIRTGSGSGRCWSEWAPYCPKCENIPSSSGKPTKN